MPHRSLFKPGQRHRSSGRTSGLHALLSSAELDRAVAMRIDDDMDWSDIAAAFACDPHRVAVQVGIEIKRRGNDGKVTGIKCTPAQMQERDERRNGYAARDITASLFGDPPRGFSALDKAGRS